MNKVEFLGVTQVPFAERYDNFIGGKFVAPISGKYFDNASPVNGQIVCKIARSDAQDGAHDSSVSLMSNRRRAASM